MSRLLPLLALALLAVPAIADPGTLPLGDDGKPLNLDFETGTLKDWTATGDAFEGQPIKGDTVAPRRDDMKSNHQGQYWIGGYERGGDKPTGTLTSARSRSRTPRPRSSSAAGRTRPPASNSFSTRAGKVFHRASGLEEEDLRREVVDLRPYKGKEIFIRLVDRHAGHWGHVNFDDFRFHATRSRPSPARPAPAQPDMLQARRPEAARGGRGDDGARRLLGEALRRRARRAPADRVLPRRPRPALGRRGVQLPAVAVAEKDAKDRILIFEDTDGDGTFDKRTVFIEGLNLVSGIEVGFGGVWIGAAPHFLFVPMKPDDDKPAGKPQILLDGWGYQDTHETLNTFTWGPDGWLYGCHGVFTHSRVGKPGTPDAKRTPINAGVWRYHPTRHVFEVFAHGTSNPWGLDFNDRGQAFVAACVIPHLWHIIQGGRYQRQAGPHFNPYTYDDIKTIAEHRHYVGATPHGGNDRSDAAGGGHAHCGTMIYLGGTWPDEVPRPDLHGQHPRPAAQRRCPDAEGLGLRRVNAPGLPASPTTPGRGSSTCSYGPDGNVYLIDWYDKQACHHSDPKIWDREQRAASTRSATRTRSRSSVDLREEERRANWSSCKLHDNDWYVRHARRLLQERGGSQEVHDGAGEDRLRPRRRDAPAARPVGAARHRRADRRRGSPRVLTRSRSQYVRGWTIQLATEERQAVGRTAGKTLAGMAKDDPSPVVRLYLASARQRLPLADRWAILEALVGHAEDAADHNLPLMYWYAAEPLRRGRRRPGAGAGGEGEGAAPAAVHGPPHRAMGTREGRRAARRRARQGRQRRRRSSPTSTASAGRAEGRAHVRRCRPAGRPSARSCWRATTPRCARRRRRAWRCVFGDKAAFAELRGWSADAKADVEPRRDALAALVEAATTSSAAAAAQARRRRRVASRGDPRRWRRSTTRRRRTLILAAVRQARLAPARRAVVNTLASRAAYGRGAARRRRREEGAAAATCRPTWCASSATSATQSWTSAIGEVWGIVRTTPADRTGAHRKSVASKLKRPPSRAGPRRWAGRCSTRPAPSATRCSAAGGKVGPDITGANRASLDYLLENILDPSAVIPKEYAMTVLTLNERPSPLRHRPEETATTLTRGDADETLTIAEKDIEERETDARVDDARRRCSRT